MAIVEKLSILYAVVSGAYKGRTCVVRRVEGIDSKSVGVILTDDPTGMVVRVRKGVLVQLETPGWVDAHKVHPYGLSEYPQMKGTGMNMLRTPNFSQPRALKMRDVLATGEVLTAPHRLGFNGSILIRLDESGWIELAPWLPIALGNYQYFKLPIELEKRDELATGSIIVKNSISTKIGWTSIFPDRKDYQLNVPSCIPIAIA